MAKIIDGKAISANVKEQVRQETEKLKANGINIGLAVVIVGDNPASRLNTLCPRKQLRTSLSRL